MCGSADGSWPFQLLPQPSPATFAGSGGRRFRVHAPPTSSAEAAPPRGHVDGAAAPARVLRPTQCLWVAWFSTRTRRARPTDRTAQRASSFLPPASRGRQFFPRISGPFILFFWRGRRAPRLASAHSSERSYTSRSLEKITGSHLPRLRAAAHRTNVPPRPAPTASSRRALGLSVSRPYGLPATRPRNFLVPAPAAAPRPLGLSASRPRGGAARRPRNFRVPPLGRAAATRPLGLSASPRTFRAPPPRRRRRRDASSDLSRRAPRRRRDASPLTLRVAPR